MQLRSHVIAPRPRVTPRPSIALARCASCGAPSIGAFCVDCLERARLHRDEDPYDDLGGEGEPS